MYKLTPEEEIRLLQGIQAIYAIPFIHDITDFIWEALFSYTKSIPIVDPLTTSRKKLLYDVVDESSKIGWSIKAIQKSLNLPTTFELVIQRADIFKKSTVLGFEQLDINSHPQRLGEALLQHWYSKVVSDAITQNVLDKRVCILLKSPNRTKYAYFEKKFTIYEAKDLAWYWTDITKTGLQGSRKADNFVVFRWYPNQKQLFERFYLPQDTFTFELKPLRLAPDEAVRLFLRLPGS
ncbi:MAG: hypothetical protein KJ063_21360 [Anaerolineae bacterium]|nr:hypothetical protein [Anaerolineae bacterium]